MNWYESENPSTVVRSASWRIAVWTVVVILFVGLIGVGFWGFKVATSDVKGRGDAVVQKNNATNRINKQEEFEKRYADIKAADDRIQTLTDAVKMDPSYTNKVNLTGATTFCQQAVQEYNALARQYTAQDFRSVDLPEQIDDFDQSTDCKPDNK